MVQLTHPYMTTGKTIALTVWTFVSKVMSLLFNTLSRFVISFLTRSKDHLISWLQSPSAAIFFFPWWLHQITFLPTVKEYLLFSTPSPVFVICSFLMIAILPAHIFENGYSRYWVSKTRIIVGYLGLIWVRKSMRLIEIPCVLSPVRHCMNLKV